MAAPWPVFRTKWELLLTPSMAADIRIAAADEGIARSEWIREACADRLARQQKARRKRTVS